MPINALSSFYLSKNLCSSKESKGKEKGQQFQKVREREREREKESKNKRASERQGDVGA